MLASLPVLSGVLTQRSRTSSSSGGAEATALLFGSLVVFLVFFLVTLLITGFVLSRVFRKAGVTPWWGYVPVLNTWGLVKLTGREPIWFVMLFIPFLNIIAMIVLYIDIAKANGHDG